MELPDFTDRVVAPASYTEHRISCLLVDDQPMVAEAVRRMLQGERDIDFHYCVEPTEALQVAARVAPTLILQDLVMPRVDGLTLVRYYRANPATAQVPLIVLSTREEAKVKAQAFALGANDYLVKLPDSAELIARIRYHSNSYILRLQRDEAHIALQESLRLLNEEKRKADALLLNILPGSIAERLKEGESRIAERYEEASVLFADIVGFTPLAARIDVDELVSTLNEIFSLFDMLAERHGVEKIKTIGDCYMAACGLPERRTDHAEALTRMGLEMLEVIRSVSERLGFDIGVRVGINSGPVVAGIIGRRKFIYDLWGDTVNTASRMESHGLPGQIHISEPTAKRLPAGFAVEPRETLEIKGKGRMQTYLVTLAGSAGRA